MILEKLESAALFRSRTVVEPRLLGLAREVKKDANFVLER